MAAFLTVTLNPALDLNTTVDRVVDAHKLRCGEPVIHPGGGGVNVARVLHRLGADVLALYTVGGATGERLSRLVVAEGVPSLYLPIGGETRESFTVRETATGHEYRFVLPGPTLNDTEWQAALDRVATLPSVPRCIVASGGLAPGVPDDFYARLARLARARGARLVLDTAGPPLAEALREGAWIVKPSLRELSDLVGRPLATAQAREAAARALVDSGQAEAVALSLGPEGALLATAEGVFRAKRVDVAVAGTVGAGDSFLAGLVWARDQDSPWPEALRTAVAAGTAALIRPGTELARPADIEALRGRVEVE
ncbi:1-phosphofructokinase family hexose kinase [Ramlibacter sp. MAHUQ-53]|uniref:1-phosphofructokinase family hexose kinase n=1 Tax=unclassified Ramlibacter TaxID=2617605 RepID=UPI003631339F